MLRKSIEIQGKNIFKLSNRDASICNKVLVFAISFPWRTQFYMAKLKIKSAKEM